MDNNEKNGYHKETASHNHHGHVHSHVDYHKEASGNLSFALVLNLLFNIVVIGGGILTNSVAILADALHDLSDTFSILVAWLLERISQKNESDTFSYGYKRFSIFGALITSTVVIIGSATVAYEALGRLFVAQAIRNGSNSYSGNNIQGRLLNKVEQR